MDEPVVGREYYFVRRSDGGIEYARFIRFDDGSAILDQGGYSINFDNAADAWRRPFAELESLGYREIGDAIARGIVSLEGTERQAKRST